MEKAINLSKEAIDALNSGDFIVVKWSNVLYLKVSKYTVEEQIEDEFFGDTPEIIFIPSGKPQKADEGK